MTVAHTDTPKTLTLDAEKYQAYLDGSDMSDAEKEAYLRAMWSLVVAFVGLGFTVEPLELSCGNPSDCDAQDARLSRNLLECLDQRTNCNDGVCADPPEDTAQEGRSA